MKVLLIGGTGVLSTAVANEAVKQGITVFMVNRGKRSLPNGVELLKSDKDDFDNIKRLIGENTFDAVIDFLCFTDAQITKSFNFYKDYTKQYFFISSCAVYDTRIKGIKSEDSPKVLPIWKYSVDKWASEEHLYKMSAEAGINYTVIRPGVTYDDTRIPYGIMPPYGYHWTLVERIKHGKPIIRWNKGDNRSSMMRVEDFAVGVVGLIGNPKAYNEAFNICGDEAPTYNDVISIIEEWLGTKAVFVDVTPEFYAKQMPVQKGEILGGRGLDAISSNEKIKSIVPAFKQTIGLREGVMKTLEAYKNNNYQKGIDWEYDASQDRTAKLWCKQTGANYKQYDLRFVNYLQSANKEDKLNYHITFNQNKFIIKVFVFIRRVFRKIKRLLFK